MRSCLTDWTDWTAAPARRAEDVAAGAAVDRELGDLLGADRTLQQAVQLLQHFPAPAAPLRRRQVSQRYEVWHGGKGESVGASFGLLLDGEELLL